MKLGLVRRAAPAIQPFGTTIVSSCPRPSLPTRTIGLRVASPWPWGRNERSTGRLVVYLEPAVRKAQLARPVVETSIGGLEAREHLAACRLVDERSQHDYVLGRSGVGLRREDGLRFATYQILCNDRKQGSHP